MRQRLLLLFAIAVTLAACTRGPTVTFGPDYFKHNESGYELIYVGSDPEHALGPGWQLDNYERLPARGGELGWFPKEGDGYVFSRGYDLTGDHVPDVHDRQTIYDLLFAQAPGDGRVWLRTIDLAKPLEGKPLGVLARRYVTKVPRTGPVFEHFGEALPAEVTWERFEVQSLEERACDVANVEAFRIDFRLREKGASPSWQRMALVLIRPGYQQTVNSNAGQRRIFESILLAAYLDDDTSFDKGLGGFDALLDHLSLAKGQKPHSCRPEQSPSAGGESPPAEVI